MRPKHCLFDVGRNMNYRIAKVKRNPSSDNHSVKLGNLENNLSIDSESFCHLFLEKTIFKKVVQISRIQKALHVYMQPND